MKLESDAWPFVTSRELSEQESLFDNINTRACTTPESVLQMSQQARAPDVLAMKIAKYEVTPVRVTDGTTKRGGFRTHPEGI